MKIIDCFPYFNEKELLELRIRLLQDHVDQFVITEANRTNTGHLKDFTCRRTLEDLGLMSDKITILELDVPSKEEEPDNHVRGSIQRDAAAEYITEGTVAFICDIDEIIDPNTISELVRFVFIRENKIVHLPMYHLISRADTCLFFRGEHNYWCPAFMCLPHHIANNTLSEIREHYCFRERAVHVPFEPVAPNSNDQFDLYMTGWHITWMGGTDAVMHKFKSFEHYDDGVIVGTPFSTPEQMLKYMSTYKPVEGGHDILCRPGMTTEPFNTAMLPQMIFDYPHIRDFLIPPK